MIRTPNFLIVSGNGRNTGKTTFVCRLISIMSAKYSVTAIKVSPHFHPEGNAKGAIIHDEHYIIKEETDPGTSKDSSRMLRSGAEKVYYIEVKDDHLAEAMKALMPLLPSEGPVICESGGIRQLIEPSLFIMINRNDSTEVKPGFKKFSPLADKIILFDGEGFDVSPEEIRFDGAGIWHKA